MSEATRLLDLIDQIAATKSRTQKEELLKDVLDSKMGRFVVKWAYDPFITFGLTPQRSEPGRLQLEFRPTLVEPLLTRLAERKLTGYGALRECADTMSALEPAGAELLFRILSKDLRCGIGAASINAVMPGFIPVFAVMRAQGFEEKRIKAWPQIVEPKLDGYRFTFLCRNGHGGFFSRSGIRQEAADHLVEPMIKTALFAYQGSVASGSNLHKILSKGCDSRSQLNFMADGEMVMPGDFNENGALRRKDKHAEGARFHIFDLMSYDDFDAAGSVGGTYMERRAWLDEFVKYATEPTITKTPRYIVQSMDEIYDYFDRFRARGLEGAMVKDPNGLYDKRKSYGWLKIKPEGDEDLPVIGAFPGEPGTKYEHCLGGLVVRRANGVKVRVGGGFSDQQREEIWELFQRELERTDKSLIVHDKDEVILESAQFADKLLIHRLVEVIYHEETPDGSLRHPRFKRFRDDKQGEVEIKEAA